MVFAHILSQMDGGTAFEGKIDVQTGRSIDVSITMYAAEAQELGPLQARNQAEYPGLSPVSHFGLAAYQIVGVAGGVLGPQLNQSVGSAARARVGEAHRLERPEGQGAFAPFGQVFSFFRRFALGFFCVLASFLGFFRRVTLCLFRILTCLLS